MPFRLLVSFAHPDDESMGMGGTLAKCAARGIETYCICASRGERGWSGPPGQYPGPGALGEIRTRELENAARELGIKAVHFLDYLDGEVDRADPGEAIGRIAAHIRRIRPEVVVTFPPDGNYGHPDHIAMGQFTCAAVLCAADSGCQTAEDLASHRVQKLYYMVDSEEFINRVAPYIGDMTFPVDGQLRGEVPWKEWMITTRVDMAEFCPTAWRAIRCHQSQLPSLGLLAELAEEAAAAALALQGTFYRAFSLVNGGRQVERDLFEGIL